MFCSRCGAEAAADARFCARCGAALPVSAPAAAAPPAAPVAPEAAEAPGPAAYAGPFTSAPPAAPPEAPSAPPAGTWASLAAAPVPAAPPIRYGGFWRRFFAAFMDNLILYVVNVPISFIVWAPHLRELETAAGSSDLSVLASSMSTLLAGWFFATLTSWFYFAFLESSGRQATLGKMMLGLKVTDLDYGRVSFARATGRYFGKWISGFILLIGYLFQPFTARRQALHDLMAGTLVVRSET